MSMPNTSCTWYYLYFQVIYLILISNLTTINWYCWLNIYFVECLWDGHKICGYESLLIILCSDIKNTNKVKNFLMDVFVHNYLIHVLNYYRSKMYLKTVN